MLIKHPPPTPPKSTITQQVGLALAARQNELTLYLCAAAMKALHQSSFPHVELTKAVERNVELARIAGGRDLIEEHARARMAICGANL